MLEYTLILKITKIEKGCFEYKLSVFECIRVFLQRSVCHMYKIRFFLMTKTKLNCLLKFSV